MQSRSYIRDFSQCLFILLAKKYVSKATAKKKPSAATKKAGDDSEDSSPWED